MHRRIALALSLAFTTIVTFSVVAVGAQAGLFTGHKTANAAPVVAQAGVTGPASLGASATPAPAQDPLVVTDYVYEDQTAVPIGVRAPRGAAAPTATQVPSLVAAASRPTSEPSAETPDEEHGATPTPPAEPTQAPPTQAPASTATAPSVPEATPTSAAPQPSPTEANGLPPEIEFTGTVTSIDGEMVTFSHHGASTTVKVTSHLSSLQIGTRAEVHAVLSGGMYVATEVELDD